MNNQITLHEAFTFAPLYAMVAGTTENLFARPESLFALRLIQVLASAATCALIWRIAFRLTNNFGSAVFAGLGTTLNPIFLIDSSLIATETIFIFFIVWAFSLYVTVYFEKDQITSQTSILKSSAAVGALLALATLTRAVTLLLPFVLVIHLMLVLPWRKAFLAGIVLLCIYGGVLSTWTIYNIVKFNRVVVGASGFSDLLFVGAVGYTGSKDIDSSYAQLNNGSVPDSSIRTSVAVNMVGESIMSDLPSYVLHRTKELLGALLQPHHTVFFPGPSLKTLSVTWVRQDRSIDGLLYLISHDYFLPKLILYIAHFIALGFGLLGIFLTRNQWRRYAPLSGLFAYFLAVHFFLLALPRYIFPTTAVLWVFAGISFTQTTIWAGDIKAHQKSASTGLQQNDNNKERPT